LLVQGLALFISSFVVALSVQWKLALITMSVIPAVAIAVGPCISAIIKYEIQNTKLHSAAGVIAQDAISSIRTIHAFTAQKKFVKDYDVKLDAARALGHKESPFIGAMLGASSFIVTAGTALAFWQGYRMYQSGEVASVGTVMTVVLSVTLGTTSMQLIGPQMQAITAAAAAAAELFGIIDKDSQLDPLDPSGQKPTSCVGEIEIKNLTFAYPSRPSAPVIKHLSLHIPAGKTTALVGASGCGKSTLVGLLEKWYQPSSGQILLDGVDISQYNTKWLRSHIRLVQQEPVLFSGTVFQNVIKGLVGSQQNLSIEKQMELVIEACKSSNAHDFIVELPEGYHTQVGERASMLSGGQKQRIAIARSIISDPKILLMDEATSALDPRAERVVQDALNKVSANKTTLIIAHKLATIQKAHNIAVISYGEVVEQGTHQELIAQGGQYASMVLSQDLGDSGKSDYESDSEDEPGISTAPDRLTLQRTQTETGSAVMDAEIKQLTRESAGYSLLRCIIIMLSEQKKLYPYYIGAALTSLLAGAQFPVQAVLFSRLINTFTLAGDEGRASADFWALMFFVLAISSGIAYFGIGYLSNEVGQVVTSRYRSEMFERILGFDQDFFDRPENSSGALTSKLSSQPAALMEILAGNSIILMVVVVNVIASSTLGIAYGWKLGLVIVFGGMPILIASGFLRIHLEQKMQQKTDQRFADSAGLATEAVTSIRTVASLTLEESILKEYAESLDGILTNAVRGLSLTLIPYALSQCLEFCIQALGFWYGSRLLIDGTYTTSQFFTIFIAVIFGGQAAGEFFGHTTSITKAKTATNYILWLRTIIPRIGETPENKGNGPSGDGPISLDNVEFRYRQRHSAKVLRGIDMKVSAARFSI
jgi:ATP-binding cassette subfamily B (MDR/TAP) protein 1